MHPQPATLVRAWPSEQAMRQLLGGMSIFTLLICVGWLLLDGPAVVGFLLLLAAAWAAMRA